MAAVEIVEVDRARCSVYRFYFTHSPDPRIDRLVCVAVQAARNRARPRLSRWRKKYWERRLAKAVQALPGGHCRVEFSGWNPEAVSRVRIQE